MRQCTQSTSLVADISSLTTPIANLKYTFSSSHPAQEGRSRIEGVTDSRVKVRKEECPITNFVLEIVVTSTTFFSFFDNFLI